MSHVATAEMLENRLVRNERRLRDWRKRRDVACYRAYDRDIPEVPVVVEVFGQHAVLWSFAFEDRLTQRESDERMQAWAAAVARGLSLDPAAVFTRRRQRQKGEAQYEKVAGDGIATEAQEAGLRFGINLSDYLDTGLFLDHRATRLRVGQEARGRRFLNLFAYTGAFTVHAAAGGAASTTSVDLSRHYLARTRENLRRNGLDGPRHRMIPADVMTWLERAPTQDERFDLVVVDPPTFSNSKRTEDDFVIQRDHVRLLAHTVRLMPGGGTLYFSTNFRKFKLDPVLEQRFGASEITPESIDPDFRDRRVHRCWRIEVDVLLAEALDERLEATRQTLPRPPGSWR